MIDLILNEPQLLFSLALTAKTCLVTLALFLVAGPLAGYYLARAPGVAPRVLGFVITIPLVFPPVALGYMLLTALGRTSLVGGALEPFGLSLIFNARPSRSRASLRAYRSSCVRFRRRSPRRASSNSRRPPASTARAGATSSSGSRSRSFGRVSRRRSFSAAPRLGRGGRGNISERTNTLSLEIFNAVSRVDFDAANALCLLLSLLAAVIFLAAELLIRRSPRL